ncbi:MAG TPA: type IV pilus assembly protein PilM [Candidatus Bipolaricaulota bacterium]|nr:type IV pilus assembly protein PilM [Candidatus Bipolaricaulota bacterium]
MALFGGKKSKNFLGVDIGGSSIKLVELSSEEGRLKLENYGYLERSTHAKKENYIDQPEEAAKIIKKILETSGILATQTYTALPAPMVFSSIISVQGIDAKELGSKDKISSAVEKEAVKILPMPLDDMVLDWKIVGDVDELKNKKSGEIVNLKILITAASKVLIQKYIDIFKKAGLNLVSLETESFAMIRALTGKDKSTMLLVDVGAVSTDISVVDMCVPHYDRSVNVGGLDITKEIAKILNIDVSQAEQLKRDLAAKPEMQKNVPLNLQKMFEPILNEVRFVIDSFLRQSENKNKRVDKIILTGGSAYVPGLGGYFTENLNIKTFIGNPWARIIYPEDLKDILFKIGPRFSIAIGLAMQGGEV